MKKLLEVKNVTKVYKIYKSNFDRLKELFTNRRYHKEFVANEDIGFDLYEGETLGIIGVNGAGKSTILKIIAGVISPTSGEIVRNGRVTALLELGTGFNEEMTGRENIYLNGTLIGLTHRECAQKERDIIDFSELGEYIDEPIKTYSSGMKMRLAFSIAIFSKPQILIVDEALAVGDAHFAAKCTKALKERKKEQMGIIYVSHDLNSLKLLCDRLLLLDKGKVHTIGDPEDVVNTYNFLISKLNDEEDKVFKKPMQKSSFGTFDVEIKKVEVVGEDSGASTVSAGETTDVTLTIEAKKDLPDMTVGILIRDRFAQDIFGTNTYYLQKKIDFFAGKTYRCVFRMPLNVGSGKYTLTAAVHSQDTHLQNCSHWLDDAADFEVLGSKDRPFIGLCKLDTEVIFEEA